MDPHQLQNNVGMPSGASHQSLQQSYQQFFMQQQQHAPAQTQYIQQLYQNPQMISDPSALFQQQSNLFLGMQNPQQSFYQPQHVNNIAYQQLLQQQHHMQNNVLQPGHNIQQTLQHVQQQHQHQVDEEQLRQQRLIEQQNRQMEQQNRQMENLRKEQEMLQRRQQEEAAREMARRQAELMEQQRREEERARREAEEEERKRREEEKRINELMRVQAEEEERKRAAVEANNAMLQKSQAIARPFTLISCAPLSRLTSLIPFPAENMATSSAASVAASSSLEDVLSTFDDSSLSLIVDALGGVDISNVMVRNDVGGEGRSEEEQHPPLIAALMQRDPNLLNVDDEHSLLSVFEGTADVHNEEVEAAAQAGPSNSLPSTSTAPPRDENALKKIISLGKQPKGKGDNKGRKKDMVESLYDSLTDYFDPSAGRRKRQKVKTYEEEQLETRELEMVAESEHRAAVQAKEKEKENEAYVPDVEEIEGRFFERRKAKKREREPDRPPTPTDVLRQREEEWRERERRRVEKRRKIDDSEDVWSHDVRTENESLARCTAIIESILDNIEIDPTEIDDESEIPQELLIDKSVLDQLRGEVQKLKSFKRMHEVPCDRLIKLLTVLERNIRDVLSTDGSAPLVPITDDDAGDEEAEAFRELVDDRLARAADAACVALFTMTSNKMPKQVFLEDTMERAVQLCKQYLTYIIYPASDVLYQGAGKNKKVVDSKGRRKGGGSSRSPIIQSLYMRMLDLMECFSELVRHHSLPDTFYHQLNTTALSCFFVNNVGELQLKAMSVLTNVFSRGDEQTRQSVLSDLLNSLHRLPLKSATNSYRLSNELMIANTTCLFMQLIQSTIKVPRKKKDRDEEEEGVVRDYSKEDAIVRDSYIEAKALANKFIMGFLNKCASKGEDDCRRLLDVFVQDLLMSLMAPEWPVAEMILNSLGLIICNLYKQKGVDSSLRQTALDYLGQICARLRKEKKEVEEVAAERLHVVVKTLLLYENDDSRMTLDDIDISHLSSNELLKKAEQGLIDYLVVAHSSSEVSIEHAIKFYVGEWYRMTLEDIDLLKENVKKAKADAESDKERRKADRKLEKAQEKGNKQREFLIEIADRKHIKKRAEHVTRTNSAMLTSDAVWLIKNLALQRDFCNSFDVFLKQILVGITTEAAVGLRTRAMKSLTLIIEADYTVLSVADVRRAVHARMTDPNAQVREATIDLLGRFLHSRPDVIEDYYQILLERIKDSGTSVRKRVIRIIREYAETHPDYEKIPEMLSRMVRRVNDEEGVKKLVLDTMVSLWLTPTKYKDELAKKVSTLTAIVSLSLAENVGGVECVEAVFAALLKGDADRAYMVAARQIVDSLVDNIIQLEMNDSSLSDADGGSMAEAEVAKRRQETMHASLSALSIFSKVRPEMMLKHAETLSPYLTMQAKSVTEQTVLEKVITMLERVLPLIEHPSMEFVERIDANLCQLVKTTGKMSITASAIACAAALYRKSPRFRPALSTLFLHYLKGLNTWKTKLSVPGTVLPDNVMTIVQRSVYALGLLARHYDWDTILENDEGVAALRLQPLPSAAPVSTVTNEEGENGGVEVTVEKRLIRDNVFTLLTYFAGHQNNDLRVKSLVSLGHLCAEYPEYLQMAEVTNLYHYVMRSNDARFLSLKIQALCNLEMFLANEEKKAIKSNAEWEKVKEQQELKEMELAGSGLGSAVIQKYWNMVLESYFHTNTNVRMAAMQVVWATLSQGLVTPGNSIHVLIAMSTDPLVAIRHKVENLVKDIDQKYSGMVMSKAVMGFRASFRLHALIEGGPGRVVRGIRSVDQTATANTAGRTVPMSHGAPKMTNDGQALLSGLYQSLRTNRMQRRSIMHHILRLFSEDNADRRLSIEEWIFVADNIAMFPYQVMDEPLYVMHTIDSIVALSGQSIVNQFKAQLVPQHPQAVTNDDDLDFEPNALYQRLPHDKTVMYELMDNSQACFTLLYLKTFLMKLYSISDAKVQEYSPSEAVKQYEKSVTRKNIAMFYPHTGMQQLQPDVRGQRGTPQGDWQLVNHVSQFRRMLLSLDRVEEEEDEATKTDDNEGTTTDQGEGGEEDE